MIGTGLKGIDTLLDKGIESRVMRHHHANRALPWVLGLLLGWSVGHQSVVAQQTEDEIYAEVFREISYVDRGGGFRAQTLLDKAASENPDRKMYGYVRDHLKELFEAGLVMEEGKGAGIGAARNLYKVLETSSQFAKWAAENHYLEVAIELNRLNDYWFTAHLAQHEEFDRSKAVVTTEGLVEIAYQEPEEQQPTATQENQPQVTSRSSESQNQPAQWMPETMDDLIACSLFVRTELSNGSGFLCNVDGVTYVYTNAHVLDGGTKIDVRDSWGNQYEDVVYLEAAAEPHGSYMANGGDIVRLRLRHYRERALTIGQVNPQRLGSKKLVVTGNTGGRGRITQLFGSATKWNQHAIQYTAQTEGGNSGSPVIDLSNNTVIAIHTWGYNKPQSAAEAIWRAPKNITKHGAGARIDNIVKWQRMSVSEFLQFSQDLRNLAKLCRLLGLFDVLHPTDQGMFLTSNRTVYGDYSVGDIFYENSGNPVIRELVELNEKLKRNQTSKIKMASADVFKAYQRTLDRAIASAQKQKRAVEDNRWTFYHSKRIEGWRAPDICSAYITRMQKVSRWYELQQGTGARARQVGARPRLPAVHLHWSDF